MFTPLETLKAFIGQVLAADGSCRQAVARVLADRLGAEEPDNTANTGPYCKARQRLPLEQLEDSARTAGLELQQKAPAEWQWKGHKVVLADGTTVTMPDTPESQAVFPQPESQKPGLGFPMARMVALISLAAGTVIAYALGPYQGKDTGETSLLSQLLDYLSAGNLLMADRYYCTFAIIALMQARNIPVLFQIHARKKANFSRGIRLGAKDHWVTWEKPKRKPVWMSAEEYATLPDTITVRELAVAGMVYVTTLFDPKTYRKQELVSLYQDHWIIELDIRAIKTHMGMDMLRCKSPDMVKKEIAVHIMAYNITVLYGFSDRLWKRRGEAVAGLIDQHFSTIFGHHASDINIKYLTAFKASFLIFPRRQRSPIQFQKFNFIGIVDFLQSRAYPPRLTAGLIVFAGLLVVVVFVSFVALVETICRRWLAAVPAIKA